MSTGSPALASRRGLWLGLLGVAIFSVTLPVTRLAVGTPEEPLLSGSFVAMARAALAAGLAALYLVWVRAPLPARRHWRPLALVALGVVLGFPWFTSIAMRQVDAVHAGVTVGLLPLATAVVAAALQRERPGLGFWACAVLGSALVVGFALLRADGSLALHPADGLLLLAVACASVGYAWGARLSVHLPAEQVICWALVIALPLSLPLAALSWPTQAVGAGPWAALGYLSVFSMWLGFFAWYRGLALGGTVRVSQVQLLQPFLTMAVAVPLLGERVDAWTLAVASAVLLTVLLGRKFAAAKPPADTP
jgi:drug/metabolite transporter (DMT)-like permease